MYREAYFWSNYYRCPYRCLSALIFSTIQ